MRNKILNKRILFALLFVCSIFVILWCYFPGLTLGNIISLLIISSLFTIAPSFTPYSSQGANIAMSVSSLLLGIGVILNAWYFTTYLGGTPTNPVLVNVDSFRWWNDAIYHFDASNGQKANISFGLYGYVLGAVLKAFGQSVGTALLWSMTLLLTALLFTGLITWRLTCHKKIAFIAIVCTASVCYWLSMGTLILKDAFVILAMIIGGYGFTFDKKYFLFLISISVIMLLFSRPGFILMIMVGIVLNSFKRETASWSIAALCLCFVIWLIPNIAKVVPDFLTVVSSDKGTQVTYNANNQMAFYNIVGDYSQLAFYKKFLLLPFSAAVQFFIPFPWNFMRDIPFGITQAWAHIGYPWYLFGFTFLYYLVDKFRSYRTKLYRLTLWALICWLIPCYLFGGTISRYGLSMVSLLAPAVAWTLYNMRKSKKFYICLAVYCVIIAIVLIFAHHLQMAAQQ